MQEVLPLSVLYAKYAIINCTFAELFTICSSSVRCGFFKLYDQFVPHAVSFSFSHQIFDCFRFSAMLLLKILVWNKTARCSVDLAFSESINPRTGAIMNDKFSRSSKPPVSINILCVARTISNILMTNRSF